MKRFKTLSVLSLALFAAPTWADVVSIHNNGLDLSRNVKYKFMGHSQSTSAGRFDITIDGDPDLAYCVDLVHGIKSDWKASQEPVSFLGATGDRVAYLFESFENEVDTNTEAAALQVALWEAVYDPHVNLDAGDFILRHKTPAVIRTQADIYLSSLAGMPSGYTPRPSTYVLKSGHHPQSQHLIVPEPVTLAFLALGGLPLIYRRRHG